MKKAIIGFVILAFVMLLCGPTLAMSFQSVDVTIDASLEWTIFDETGLMPGATGEAPNVAVPELTIFVGAWEASTEDAYIKYTAEVGTISFENSVGYSMFDLENDIVEAQGVLLGAKLASSSWDLVYTTNAEYGLGAKYDTGVFSAGAKYNSTDAYGLELVYPIAPITLTGQYAIRDESAYLVKAGYALTGEGGFTEDSEITLQYKIANTSEIKAELVDYPITMTTMLNLAAVNAGGDTDLSGEVVFTLVPGVELTLSAANTAGAFSYSGKIGVTF